MGRKMATKHEMDASGSIKSPAATYQTFVFVRKNVILLMFDFIRMGATNICSVLQ
jgi:hypothetical protein